jgi:hypothetical protein
MAVLVLVWDIPVFMVTGVGAQAGDMAGAGLIMVVMAMVIPVTDAVQFVQNATLRMSVHAIAV